MINSQFAAKNGPEIPNPSGDPAIVEHSAPRVLAVDDDPGIRLLMQETLAKAGFEVRGAASGREAIDLCCEFTPDLLLLDINMPVMDGISACSEIRKQIDRDFPIIMVTSVDDAVSIQRAFDAGATDFILKPVNWPLFQRRLDSVLAEWNRDKELDANSKRVRLLEKVVPEQVMLVSRSGAIIEDLKRHRELGQTNSPTPNRSLADIYGPDVSRRLQQRISGVLKTGRHNNLEFSVDEHGIARSYEAQFLVEGRDRVIIVVQDVSGEKQTESEIRDLAYFDSMTGLPNRHLFERSAKEHITEARLQGRSLAFVSLCFENISQQDLSDRNLMRTIADRLSHCLAGFDSALKMGNGENGTQVSRVDSNQFVLAVQHGQGSGDLDIVCDTIARKLAGSVVSGEGSIAVSPRMGISVFPIDGKDLQSVMHAAGNAMHEALETGQRSCSYSQAANAPDFAQQDYGKELQQALDLDQLELYFQPRLSMSGDTISSVEALLRWNHPMRGFVDLSELLYLAKTTGLIVPLGDWVLNKACEAARHWQCDAAPRISVNLSQQEFAREDLADRVIEALERNGLEPDRLELELTEEALLRTRNGLAGLEKLKALGVGLVLDDFGTGHSSLACLKQYPIDALKIDGSFVRDLPGNENDAAVCEVIVTMAQLFGMKAVAEGVETKEQLEALRKMGCDEFQGFHVCRPLPGDEIEGYLRQMDNRR